MTRNISRAFRALIIAGAAIAGPASGTSAGPTLTPLHSFAGADGRTPVGNLLFDSYGALYGLCKEGGATHLGTVFLLTPPAAGGGNWSATTLYSFRGGADGSNPVGNPVFDSFGALYGVTSGGGSGKAGTVFKLSPPVSAGGGWTETVLYQFTGGGDGGTPLAGVILDTFGSVYGVTEKGGAVGAGTVFKLSPPATVGQPWTESVLYSFNNAASGGFPKGELIFDTSGSLYGTTSTGPGPKQFGSVFKLTPPATPGGNWSETTLYVFKGASDGGGPAHNLIFDTFGGLYGTTSGGGPFGLGTVFKLTPTAAGATWTEAILYRFAGPDGKQPQAGLLLDTTGTLYGTTSSGGSSGNGVVFRLSPPASSGGAWVETSVYQFGGNADGGQPVSSLATDGSGAVYGATGAGGLGKAGSVFRLMP